MSSPDYEDQTIVINNLLSFASCKLGKLGKHTLKSRISSFYSKEDFDDALKTIEAALEPQVTYNPKDDPVDYILDLLESTPAESLPIFVCRDLSNVPNNRLSKDRKENVKLSSKDRFLEDHNNLKAKLTSLFKTLCELKKQYELASGKKFNISKFSETAKKLGLKVQEKPLVKDLNYLQSLIDAEGENEIALDNSAINLTENEDDIVQQRINLIANRRQRASLRFSKVSQDPDKKPKIQDILNSNTDNDENDESKRKILVDTIYDDSRKISTSIYRCSFCAFRTTDKTAANNHTCETHIKTSLKSKTKVPRYVIVEQMFDDNLGIYTLFKCSSCPYVSNQESATLGHICLKVSYEKQVNGTVKGYRSHSNRASHRRQKSYDCHNCGASFKMRKELQKHIESHIGDGYRCPLCADRFPLENWLEHVRGCPGDGTTLLEDHYCEVCDVFYADKRTLSFHRAFHDPSRPFQCVECKFRFYTQKTVEDHYRTHALHRNSIKCPFCDFKAFKTAKIVDHIRCHTGDRPYKCPQCDRSCTTYNALKVHLTSHAPDRDFACDICGKKFKSQNKVASHRKIHNMERPHKCPVCGKGFKFGLQMALHHRMHLDIRKHACTLCPYKARTAAVLRGHINTHTKAKPFKCNQCNFGANHKSYLNWHIKCYHPKPEQLAEDY